MIERGIGYLVCRDAKEPMEIEGQFRTTMLVVIGYVVVGIVFGFIILTQ